MKGNRLRNHDRYLEEAMLFRDTESESESANKILKAELVYRETFGTTRELQVKLADYVHWYNNFRIHSTLGYMTPVEFRKAGLVLPRSSKKM